VRVAESGLCFCMSYSLKRDARVLGDLFFRSGETFSPKREYEGVRVCFGTSRTGEGIWTLGD